MQAALINIFPIKMKRIEYEKPAWAGHLSTVVWDDLSRSLPTVATQQGYRLRWVEYDYVRDPVILYDRNRRIVHEWQYIPSLTEVFEVCRDLGLVTVEGE